MSIYISPNAYGIERNGISLSSFIKEKEFIYCSSGDLKDIEEKCCFSIIYISKKDNLLSLGLEIGYFYCHHMAVFAIIDNEETQNNKSLQKELDDKKMLIIDIERMFYFLDILCVNIKFASSLFSKAKNISARDSFREEFRDCILDLVMKKRDTTGDISDHVPKEPIP